MKLTATTVRYKRFSELTDDEKTELVVGYYVKGRRVEYRGAMGDWFTSEHRTFVNGHYYRLADQPQPKQGATIEFTHDELVRLFNMVNSHSGCIDLHIVISEHLTGEAL